MTIAPQRLTALRGANKQDYFKLNQCSEVKPSYIKQNKHMKKLLYCAVALAMTLFAGSCQKENLEQVKGGKTISFTVAAPGQIQTKAIADGMNVDVLHYEVYSREQG